MTTIRERAERLISKGKTNEQVANAICSQVKGAKTTPGSVAWYRSKMKDSRKAKRSAKAATKH
jgi:hypothetical protein